MLVSGGNGFLGSHLVDRALKEGVEVTVVDDMSTSKGVQVPREARFVKKSIEKYETGERFDFVVHLAARPSPEDYISKPVSTISSNSIGTLRMIEIAKRGSGTLMYTSSSEVYGDAALIPTPESYFGYVNPNGIRSCYDESKRFSEALIMAYNREHGLDARIQRPFNVYGPRIREDGQYGRVIPRFIAQALKGSGLTVYGTGSQTRSFLYVNDWIDASWKLLTKPDLSGTIVNIGTNDEITVNNLAKMIIRLTKSGSSIKRLPAREEDPRRRAADMAKARRVLKWKPRTDLKEGLSRTIDWFGHNA